MRIAFVHPRAPGAEGTGAAHSATRIVHLLGEMGHEVVVYCLREPGDRVAGRYQTVPLDLNGFPFHSALALDARLRERADELDGFDVIHSYLPRTLSALEELGRKTSAATVLTLNAYGAVCPKNDLRHLDREPCRTNGIVRCGVCCAVTAGGHEHGALYQLAGRVGNLALMRRGPEGPETNIDRFQALSEHVRDIHVGFGFPSDRIHIVPNILDPRFLVEHRSSFSPPWRLLYVGSLEEHKGVLLLPKVLERLKARANAPIFRLTVVGEGTARDRLRRELEDRGLDGRVEMKGGVPNADLPMIYAEHDLLVYPGVWDEPFGRVLLESLAAGTPVVGTDVGAVAEIVGEAGTVVEPAPGALAETIWQAVKASKLERWGETARDQVSRYRPAALEPAFRSLYAGL